MSKQIKSSDTEHIPSTMEVGVVLERRDINNKWADHEWKLAGVIPGKSDLDDWQILRSGKGWTQFYAGTQIIKLFKRETEGYKVNLSQTKPMVFVVLRPEEEGEHDYEVTPFEATVCPFEAEGYDESGDEWVEGTLMPDLIYSWVNSYVECFHVDVPFKKRKRKAYDPRKQRNE